MDPFQGIVVQILSNGQSLTLYDNPDSDDVGDGDSRQRYVEATTGATFSVRVTLTTEFNLYHLRPLDAIRITLNLDGNNWKVSLSRKRIEGHFLLGQPYEYTWSRITQFCPTTGQWITSELTFGKLEISESTNISLPVDQAKNLGRMSVRTQRVKRERRSVLGPPSKRSVSTVKEVAEKALKGRSIANAVSFTNNRQTSTPPPSDYKSRDLPGPAGKAVEYSILYRSKNALQMIGCIPRSPSPVEEISDDADSTQNSVTDSAAPRDLRQENRNLRARLALLERDTNVKIENVMGVKREREDDQNLSRGQRPRKLVKVETIDLTDD